MSTIIKWWRAESALIIALALAVVGAGVVTGTWQRLLLAVLPLLGGAAVRRTVWAPDTVEATVDAAATLVAAQLTTGTAGSIGEIGPGAQAVVDGVVAGALASPTTTPLVST